MTPAIDASPSGGELLDALESAIRIATFPWPLSMATPRDKWEALLSLLMGQQPVLGRSRAGDLPYLEVSQTARRLTRLLHETCFDVWRTPDDLLKVTLRRGAPECSGHRQPARTPVLADTFLCWLGLHAYLRSRALSNQPARDRLYEGVLESLIDFLDAKLGKSLGGRLRRLLGFPGHDRPREKFKTLREKEDEAKEISCGAALIGGTFSSLACLGGAAPADRWWEVHIRAERVQSYLARFRAMSLRRGASAMVGDVIACVRERIVDQTSVACLVQDLGGTLVLLLPGDFLDEGAEILQEHGGTPAEALSRWVRSMLADSLRPPGGYFRAQYPLGCDVADAASRESRGISLDAWASRGLFPDLSVRMRQVGLAEWLSGRADPSDQAGFQQVPLRCDADLFATPPRSLEPRCFGCHFEQGTAVLPWWRDRERLCPACTLVATAGRRLSEHALEGALELHESFRNDVLGASQKDAFGPHAYTIYLDGSGVGRRMFLCGPWERAALSRELEAEVRRRYGAGVHLVGEERRKAGFRNRLGRSFPLEIIFIGGDDVCVAVHTAVAQAFLQGFLAEPRRELRWAGVVLVHGTDHFELVRLQAARTQLMKEAKGLARQDGDADFTLVLARLAPLPDGVHLGEEAPMFDRVETSHGLEDALERWPHWEVKG